MFWLSHEPAPAPRPLPQFTTALSVLQSQEMAFLVTRRASTQIIVECRQEDLWGRYRGILWATVSWRWGIDMQKLSADDVRRQGEVLWVRLPEPQLLDFGIEPGSMGYMDKSTAVAWVRNQTDQGVQRSELEGRLREKALEFMASRKLTPSRDDIVRQLNRTAEALAHPEGPLVRFE
jgi:hypothetical protein